MNKKKTIVIGGKRVQAKVRKLPTKKETPKPPVKRTLEQRLIQRQSVSSSRAKIEFRDAANIRDISLVPPHSNFKPIDLKGINWERRVACKKDPLLDLETYMPKVFYLGWADFHRKLIQDIADKIIHGGKKAFGMPRGSGKTACSRGMIQWATKYGYRKFPFFIGSKEDKAMQTLSFIQGYWFRSKELQQDFPEIAYPIYRIEGRPTQGMHGQTYKGERTHLIWTKKEMQYPCLLFEEEDVAGYLEHDPDCVTYLPDIGIDIDRFLINNAGCLIRVSGIDGSIRGEADLHPILLTQPRPDFILLDDVQKDQKADSPKSCEDLERLIEAAIEHLSSPDVNAASLMPCTVIREDDVADRYLQPLIKPDWTGVRYGVISKYPPGIDDDVIHAEIDGKPNKQGALWNEYRELREKTMREYGDLRLANEFYRTNRKVMDKGFEITWEDRYKSDTGDPDRDEVSAIQAAMNWRFKDHLAFLSEGQNRPKMRAATTGLLIKPGEIAEKTTFIPRNQISLQWTNIVAFIDIQDEILFYTLFAHDHNYTGQFIDYGTFPKTKSQYFRKNQTYGWSLLTREFYKAHPEARAAGLSKTKTTKLRAPFDAKIYLALKQCCSWLLARRFTINGQHFEERGITALGIDTKWGKASEVCKRFIREFNDQRVIAFQGHPFMPSHKQLEEYSDVAGWLFEHQQHPAIQESKWVMRPYRETETARYVLSDVNRWKSFLMKRLGTPVGSDGCITLYDASVEEHQMFADHLGGSEYPEPILARGMQKDCWQPRPNRGDENDYLDCAVGCLCLASICGASIKSTEGEALEQQKRQSLRDIYDKKRRGK